MKVYLAAAWSRREEIALVADKLRALGITITSNWLTEETAMQTGAREKFLRDRAYLDLRDVDECDALVRFSDTPYLKKEVFYNDPVIVDQLTRLVSGARMFEMGYAKARGKTIYVVGGKQNVFDRLDGVVHLKNVDELLKVMSQED